MDTVYRRVREVLYRDWSETKDIRTPGGCNVVGQTRCPCARWPTARVHLQLVIGGDVWRWSGDVGGGVTAGAVFRDRSQAVSLTLRSVWLSVWLGGRASGPQSRNQREWRRDQHTSAPYPALNMINTCCHGTALSSKPNPAAEGGIQEVFNSWTTPHTVPRVDLLHTVSGEPVPTTCSPHPTRRHFSPPDFTAFIANPD
ncbi:hypothetical protein C0Q70_14624 [Pomacea canaliculata]|uniref:Uncharacterized protein n=1 Tax=Pomacea canaliculata TaxID=400727 RepID=A0A2T7NSK4_POMCA|nr:hypothetical protein C0Q70_14624 [Pomacea canaliculata]